MQIFQPEELMAMVVGNEDYDWNILELTCEYRNGYTASDDTVCKKFTILFRFYVKFHFVRIEFSFII